mgnify:CR=1 FL=1
MAWQLFTIAEVVAIHDRAIATKELQGLAIGKSLDGALGRIEHRIQYGVITDIFDLAATYAMATTQGHVFNDANKRTAYACMNLCLIRHGVRIAFSVEAVGTMIIRLAQGALDERELAAWLRQQSREN